MLSVEKTLYASRKCFIHGENIVYANKFICREMLYAESFLFVDGKKISLGNIQADSQIFIGGQNRYCDILGFIMFVCFISLI